MESSFGFPQDSGTDSVFLGMRMRMSFIRWTLPILRQAKEEFVSMTRV
jgi:hypothetical protein